MKTKAEDKTVTHSTNSTSRKKVGTYATSGLHINKDQYLTLPTMNLSSETTENIADGVAMSFEILSAASDLDANDLYKAVDSHMTDATTHNKGLAQCVADKMEREVAAGQLFCGSHTNLAFDRTMSEVIHIIEDSMGMSNIFSGFLVDINIDQKQDTISLSAVSWMLNLFGPDMTQKPWNYHNDFMAYMNRINR